MSDVNFAIEDLLDVFGMIMEAMLDQGFRSNPKHITESFSGELDIAHLIVNGTHSGQPVLPLQDPTIQTPLTAAAPPPPPTSL